eukprot:jgi/Mesvir1/1603/Mv14567-RA.2
MASAIEGCGEIKRRKPIGRIGEYIIYDTCRVCGSSRLFKFMDFGFTALNGIFPANQEEITQERKYPLTLHFCEECALVQVLEVIPPDHLYRSSAGYFYYSSAIDTSVRHFATLADDLRTFYAGGDPVRDPGEVRLLEMGCNDGILLRPLRERGFRHLAGCDPATNCTAVATADGFQVYDEYFGAAAAELIARDHGAGTFDCIVTCNSFAHVDDMWDIMDGVKQLLRPDGILVVEVHYLLPLLKTMQFDGIYHEHMTHYSLTSMANFARMAGMDVFDARELAVHGGSVRFCIQREGGGRPKSDSFLRLAKAELEAGLGFRDTYAGFSARIQAWSEAMRALVQQLRSNQKTIFGYGASARATTIINICKQCSWMGATCRS